MQPVIIDILNNKAVRLLQYLELQLIRMRKEKTQTAATNQTAKYKGAMTKQLLTDIDNQLNQLCNEW